MTRRLLVAAVTAATILLAFAGPASAGGWAVTTLDPLPAGGLAAGHATPIGYTVRQHGMTPIRLDDSHLVVTMADGGVLRFLGVPDGPPGHHVAMVTVPTAGRFALATDQGWFPDQALGHLDVGTTGAAIAAPGSTGGWPTTVVVVTAVVSLLALVLVALQIGALVHDRRRGHLAGT